MGNIKIKIAAIICSVLYTGNLFGVDNINDIKPHSYGLNNFSVGLTPGLYASANNEDKTNFGNGFGLSLHSKASLKQHHYKVGEWFWDGGVSFHVIGNENIYSNHSNSSDLDLNTGIGYSTNYSSFVNSISAGLGFRNISDSSGVLPTSGDRDAEIDKFSSPYAYAEYAAGFDYRKVSFGFIYKGMISKDNDKNELFFEQRLKMPFQKNINRDHAITYSPEIRQINSDGKSETVILFRIGLSWIYN